MSRDSSQIIIWPVRPWARFRWKTIWKKSPEGRTRQVKGPLKNAYGPARKALAKRGKCCHERVIPLSAYLQIPAFPLSEKVHTVEPRYFELG